MSSYNLNFTSTVELSDYSSIYDYLSLVGNDDLIKINLNSNAEGDIKLIGSLLNREGFNYTCNFKDVEGVCTIIAVKNQ